MLPLCCPQGSQTQNFNFVYKSVCTYNCYLQFENLLWKYSFNIGAFSSPGKHKFREVLVSDTCPNNLHIKHLNASSIVSAETNMRISNQNCLYFTQFSCGRCFNILKCILKWEPTYLSYLRDPLVPRCLWGEKKPFPLPSTEYF